MGVAIKRGRSPTNDRLVWEWWDEKGRYRRRSRQTPHVLQHFVGLADATDRQIAKYAGRYGPLGLSKGWRQYERLTEWRLWAWRLRAMLNVLAPGLVQKLDPDDWYAVDPSGWDEAAQRHGVPPERPVKRVTSRTGLPANKSEMRQSIGITLDRWLEMAGVRPHIYGLTNRFELQIRSPKLFGGLVYQLVVRTSGHQSSGIGLCSSCGSAYFADRSPRADQNHYCPACRKQKIPERDAARHYRARNR